MKKLPNIPEPKLDDRGMYSVSYTKEEFDYLQRMDTARTEAVHTLAKIREMVIDEDERDQSDIAVIRAVWLLQAAHR